MKKSLIGEQNVRHRKLFDATNLNSANKFFHMEDAVKRNAISLLRGEKRDSSQAFLILESLVKIEPLFHVAMIAWPKNQMAPVDVDDFDIYCLWWDGIQYIRMVNPVEWRDRSRLPWIRNTMKIRKENWCVFYEDPLFQCEFSTYAVPCKDAGGNVRGIIGTGFSLQNIGFDLKETTLNQFSNSFIYFNSGKILFRASNGYWYDPLVSATNYSKADLQIMIDRIQQEMKNNVTNKQPSVTSYSVKNIMGARRIYILQYTSENFGYVSGEFILEQRIQETASKANNLIFVYFVAAFILAFCLSWFFTRYFTRPVTALKNSIYRIAAGNFDVSLPQKIIPRELNDLRSSFEIMQIGIKNQISQLAKTTALQEMTSAQFDVIKVLQQKSFPIDFEKLRQSNIDLNAKIHIAENRLTQCFYDFDQIEGGLLAFCVGRFSSSSISYLLFTAQIAAFLWGNMTEQKDPALTLWLVNQELSALNKPDMLFSILCGIYNPQSRKIIFAASRGAEAAVVDPSGNVYPVDYKPGPLVLEKSTGEYFNKTLELESGSIFFCTLENGEKSQDQSKAAVLDSYNKESIAVSDENVEEMVSPDSPKAANEIVREDRPLLEKTISFDDQQSKARSSSQDQKDNVQIFRSKVVSETCELNESGETLRNGSSNTAQKEEQSSFIKAEEKAGPSCERTFMIQCLSECLNGAESRSRDMKSLIADFIEKRQQCSDVFKFDDVPLMALRAGGPVVSDADSSANAGSNKNGSVFEGTDNASSARSRDTELSEPRKGEKHE